MSENPDNYYKLRAVLSGHEKEVRCLTSGIGLGNNLSNCIISGSRDLTIRLWKPNENDYGYTEQFCAGGHSSFISCISVLPAGSADYPNGAIISGSGDGTILVHTLESAEPVKRIANAHDNVVSAMYIGENGYMITGSWDYTVKIWMNFNPAMTLKGHEAAVWCVLGLQSDGMIISGAADKQIRIWSAGECLSVLTGHADCVRGLCLLPPTSNFSERTLLSCSNDATIKRWNIHSGTCLSTFNGHTNFIYSITCAIDSTSGSPYFISVGEDRTLRIWNPLDSQAPVQTIPHSATSLWAVTILQDGDIVCGCSDGKITVFTKTPDRTGPSELLAEFELSVSKTAVPAQTFGGIQFSDLPNADVLLYPGKRDGQTIMVKYGEQEKDAKVECHMWSSAEQKWNLVGTVVGSNETGSSSSGGKAVFEGKEYDYVFDVDLDDRSLKLPYNRDENPWIAAHNFVEKNALNPVFIEEVANFITKNSSAVTIGAPEWQGNPDPFTGGSSYHTAGDPHNGNNAGNGRIEEEIKYFPEKNYLLFKNQPNLSGLRSKLLEFDAAHAPNSVGEVVLNGLVDSVAVLNDSQDGIINEENVHLLSELISWPDSHLVPILDLIRIVALNDDIVAFLFKNPRFLPVLLKQLMPEKPTANQFLTLRILSNAFASGPGRMIMLSNSNRIVQATENMIDSNNKSVQIANATVLLNYAVLGSNEKLAETKLYTSVIDIIRFTIERGLPTIDCEAMFRFVVALGTLVSLGQVDVTAAIKQHCQIHLKNIQKNIPAGETRIKDSVKALLLLAAAS